MIDHEHHSNDNASTKSTQTVFLLIVLDATRWMLRGGGIKVSDKLGFLKVFLVNLASTQGFYL